jgi:CTP-dependent riboflavin kinase
MSKKLGEMMSESTLSGIEDYDTLKGEKRRVVWGVIISGLLVGAIYVGAKAYYGNVDDALNVDTGVAKVPLR